MSDQPSGKFEQSATKLGEVQVIGASDELFNHVDDNRPMWAGDGDRRIEVTFQFAEPFREPPALTLGVIGIDCDQAHNLRYSVTAQNLTKTSFDVVFVTWGDTRIARASVSWQAIGMVRQALTQNRPMKAYTAE